MFFVNRSNPSFTFFLLVVRYWLLGIALIGFGFYLNFYLNSSKTNLTFEHHYIMILSIGLLMMNDPLSAATILIGTPVFVVFSTIYVTLFLSLILFFWTLMYTRIHSEIDKKETNLVNCWNISYSFAFFIFLTSVFVSVAISSRSDPGLNQEK